MRGDRFVILVVTLAVLFVCGIVAIFLGDFIYGCMFLALMFVVLVVAGRAEP